MSPHSCKDCGESDPDKFYGHRKDRCGKCHNKYVLDLGKQKRAYALELLGGCCSHCGYDKHSAALQIHHLDPTTKDPNFNCLRGWSKKRIRKELETCILLCANCHMALHAGQLLIDGL